MSSFPAKMPGFLKKIFSNYVWDFFSENNPTKTLYLTFDDGPVPEATEFVLEELSKYNAKATFFCIGDNIEKHPDIFSKVKAQGHAIGNHTHNHLKGWKSSKEEYVASTLKTQDLINSSRQMPNAKKLFRPPFGRIKKSQGRQLMAMGYKIIMWDVVAKDWMHSVSEEQCLKNVIRNATNGSIVVLHDSIKASKNVRYTLPRVLEHFSKKGFQFKAIEL